MGSAGLPVGKVSFTVMLSAWTLKATDAGRCFTRSTRPSPGGAASQPEPSSSYCGRRLGSTGERAAQLHTAEVGLDGPLRGLPHEEVAPATPALEQQQPSAGGFLRQAPRRRPSSPVLRRGLRPPSERLRARPGADPSGDPQAWEPDHPAADRHSLPRFDGTDSRTPPSPTEERVDSANGPRITCCCRRSLRATRVPTGGRATLADNAEMSRSFAAIRSCAMRSGRRPRQDLHAPSVAFTLAPACPGPAGRPIAGAQNSQTRPACTA